ncbi:MAG: mechanosensitive ion channel family protein [Pseudomonadota bacterium]
MEITFEPARIVAEEFGAILRGMLDFLPNLVAALTVVLLAALLAWIASLAVRAGFSRSTARPSLVEAIRKLAKTGVWAVGLLIAATIAFPGLTPADLVAGLGIGSIAVGLAFRDIFENFLAGFLILLRKPMRIGDDIRCEGISGRVEEITIRDTHVRKRSGELLLVPNSFLFKNPLQILTDLPIRRIEIVAGIAYGEDVDAAREVIRKAMEHLPTVSAERPVEVFATTFGASSVDFMVRWWTASTPIDEHRSRDEAVAAIKQALDGAGIEIPFPHRTLTFKGPGPAIPGIVERSDPAA